MLRMDREHRHGEERSMVSFTLPPRQWAEEQFGACQLGDQRRTQRGNRRPGRASAVLPAVPFEKGEEGKQPSNPPAPTRVASLGKADRADRAARPRGAVHARDGSRGRQLRSVLASVAAALGLGNPGFPTDSQRALVGGRQRPAKNLSPAWKTGSAKPASDWRR